MRATRSITDQRVVRRFLSLLSILVMSIVVGNLFLPPNPAYAQRTRETRLGADIVASVIETFFIDTQLHLNNFGPRHGNSYHVADDSFVRFSPALGGSELRFTISEEVIDKPGHNWKYYVNDINLDHITVGIEEHFFKISLHLEDAGNELKGMCPSCVPRFRDSRAPDVQIDGGRVDILLRPAARGGSLAYDEVQIRLEGRIQAGGICDRRILGRLCDRTGYREKIRQAVERALSDQLHQDFVRNLIADAFRPTLVSFGIGEVVEVSILDGNLVITHR